MAATLNLQQRAPVEIDCARLRGPDRPKGAFGLALHQKGILGLDGNQACDGCSAIRYDEGRTLPYFGEFFGEFCL